MYNFNGKSNDFFSKPLKILIINFFLFTAALSSLVSCKDDGKISPVLSGEIVTPLPGFTCQFNDTITVSGNFSCNYPIQSASISLVNSAYDIVVPGMKLAENVSGTYNFFTDFFLDNTYAPSGYYYLRLSAVSEGQIIFLDNLVKIHVTEVPRTTLKNYCVTGNSSAFSLYEFTAASSTLLNSYNFTFTGMHTDSRYKRIYLCGKEKAIGLNSASLSGEFQLSPLALNADSFLTSELFSTQLTLARNDGNIVFYNSDGQRQGETGENIFIRPLLTHSTASYLYTSIQKNADRKIAVYFLPSGVARQELLIDFDVVGFSTVNETEQLVFANKTGHTMIYLYLLSGNTVQLLKDIPATFLNTTFVTESGTIFLLTDSGLIKYDPATNSTTTVNSGIFQGMNYDEVNDILYCFSANNIKLLQGTSFADLGDRVMADSVMGVGVVYSK